MPLLKQILNSSQYEMEEENSLPMIRKVWLEMIPKNARPPFEYNCV